VCKNLNNNPKYNALSCTWGNSNLCCIIRIGGMELAITANLDSALRRLCSKSQKFLVWADGICINQSDIPECNQQVLLIQRIYSQCCKGLIYPGEEGYGSSLIPGFLQEFYNGFLGLVAGGRPRGDWVMSQVDEGDFPSPLLPDKDHPGWGAFRKLLRCPWFLRIWVIQELAFPKNVLMICGKMGD
jgi:hypothetical protein